MKGLDFRIIPMSRAHLSACNDIVRVSEPWKTYREGVDLKAAIRLKQAHVLTIGGAVAGFVVFDPEPVFARGGYLRAVAVAPAIRGFGIGSTLLAFAEQRTARKTANLYLCVSSFNKDGQKFYRRSGYEKVGKIDGLVKKGSAEHILRKKLKR